jgi:hypothetical protein
MRPMKSKSAYEKVVFVTYFIFVFVCVMVQRSYFWRKEM